MLTICFCAVANLAAYMDGPVFDVIEDVLGRSAEDVTQWRRDDFDKVVAKVCPTSVSRTMFDYNGQRISVFEYFTRQLGIRLRHRNGPCLECKGGRGAKIPAEVNHP